MNAAPHEYNPNPPLEEQIRTALQALQALFEERNQARNRGDQAQVALIEQRITQAMRRVGDAYPAGEARRNWHRQAEEFQNANGEEREHILLPIAKRLDLLIAAPLASAGVIVVGALGTIGTVLYAAGKVVQGLGSSLTGGTLR